MVTLRGKKLNDSGGALDFVLNQEALDFSNVSPVCTRVRLQGFVQRCTERFVQMAALAGNLRPAGCDCP